ncbi:hypothetical protein CLOM_g17924 [Closterium sp. NIES-68]|nr:hypothetical protein CLOM_g17924 [Closterium sp. NIES-68]
MMLSTNRLAFPVLQRSRKVILGSRFYGVGIGETTDAGHPKYPNMTPNEDRSPATTDDLTRAAAEAAFPTPGASPTSLMEGRGEKEQKHSTHLRAKGFVVTELEEGVRDAEEKLKRRSGSGLGSRQTITSDTTAGN